VHIDLTEAYDSAQKIKHMADILIPLHDLKVGRHKHIP
jgi:N-acyl homoserine lactone hydrolase